MNDQKTTPEQKPKKKGISKGLGCLIIIIVFAVIGLISMLGGNKNTNTTSTTPSNSTTPVNQKSDTVSLQVGEEGILKPSDLNSVYLAVDEQAYDELSKALLATDTQGVADLLIKGKIFEASGGSKVLVIDSKTFSRKVRILEEVSNSNTKAVGEAGWIPYEWVVKQ